VGCAEHLRTRAEVAAERSTASTQHAFPVFRNFFSFSETYSLACSRAVMLDRRHPGSVRASSGRHQPERWSRERRLRAGLKSPAPGRPREPPPDTTIRPDAFRGGRGSPPADKTPRWSAERRALTRPCSGVGRRGTPHRGVSACPSRSRKPEGDHAQGCGSQLHQRFSALRSLTHACIVGSVRNRFGDCSPIRRCAGCLTS
jgi:hypothetical protein